MAQLASILLYTNLVYHWEDYYYGSEGGVGNLHVLKKGEGGLLGWHDPDENRSIFIVLQRFSYKLFN